MKKKQTIAVVGLGYVGLPLALLADEQGYRVFGIDIDSRKVDLINRRKSPFLDADVERAVKKSGMTATSDFARAGDASVVVLCVPTPVNEKHTPDLRPVEGAARGIGPHLRKGQLIVLESTVNPGITEKILLPILERESGLAGGADFSIAHCPERINPGDTKWKLSNIPRVVGSTDAAGLRKAAAFYRSILSADVIPMQSVQEAEAVKIVENSFRDINIAFVNELAQSFSRLGIDIMNVIKGASAKPFAFMAHYPGCGVGGHCIPVDPYYLIEYAAENGYHHEFLSLARRINDNMPRFTAELAARALNERGIPINGARIALLGLAYKPNIDDVRESPSFEIEKHLREYGADVRTFDPFVKERSSAATLDEALSGAQAAVIATAHTPFIKLGPKHFLNKNVHVVIDGRNCLPKEAFLKAGITYKGIGR